MPDSYRKLQEEQEPQSPSQPQPQQPQPQQPQPQQPQPQQPQPQPQQPHFVPQSNSISPNTAASSAPRAGYYSNNNSTTPPSLYSWSYYPRQQHRFTVPPSTQPQVQPQPQPQQQQQQQRNENGQVNNNERGETEDKEETSRPQEQQQQQQQENNGQVNESSSSSSSSSTTTSRLYPELSDMNGTNDKSYPWIHPKPVFPLLAAICSFFFPGVGHMFLGQHRKGLWLFVLNCLFSLFMFVFFHVRPLHFLYFVFVIVFQVIVAVDSFRTAKRIRKGYPVYQGECSNAFVTALLKEFSWMGKDTPVFNRRVDAECPAEWKSVIQYFDSQRFV